MMLAERDVSCHVHINKKTAVYEGVRTAPVLEDEGSGRTVDMHINTRVTEHRIYHGYFSFHFKKKKKKM